MKKRKSKGSHWFFLFILSGILLSVVCLFSACGKKDAVFLAGQETPEEAAAELSEPTLAQEELESLEGRELLPAEDEPERLLAVYVCGQVTEPGVYELRQGARMADAIEMAGGMTKEAALDVLNLAQELTDGQMIRVPSAEEAASLQNGDGISGTGGLAGGSAETAGTGMDLQGRISLNAASLEQLMSLPGIGQSRAEAILQYREERGGFRNVEEIMNVSGIKEGIFLKIKDQITV